jgi:phage tail sheath protein FI
MPEYLAPGVYVEETSFRAKSIEGVGTSTTAFAGPTRRGPIDEIPELVTSFADFQRVYGGLGDVLGQPNYVAHAVRSYFNEGGSRLYVSRVYSRPDAGDGRAVSAPVVKTGNAAAAQAAFVARYPGSGGNGRIALRLSESPATLQTLRSVPVGTFLRGAVKASDEPTFYRRGATAWADADDVELKQVDLDKLTVLDLLTIAVDAEDADGNHNSFEDLGFHRTHPRWIGTVMKEVPDRRADQLENIYAVRIGADVDGFALYAGLFGAAEGRKEGDARTVVVAGGNDGSDPVAFDYEAALSSLESLDDISIVAAPGSSAYESAWPAAQGSLISHAERARSYRIAVLDTAPDLTLGGARGERSRIDSKYAAVYFPWVTVANPLARPGRADIPAEINLPPSGFVCGIYARNDVERGVHKAPANEVVRGALRFESDINFAQQGVLNPIGVNCLRFFPGRGYRVWGARLASSDPEWKYVNVRRYFNYLERSVDVGTQWAVFEPNGERLWANVRETVSSFLYNEWRNGALLGANAKEAYFVRCDRSTMTQNDLDNGRMICLVGVAVIKPAEFVIFRIGQKTADSRQ